MFIMQDIYDQILRLVRETKDRTVRYAFGGVDYYWFHLASLWDGERYLSVLCSQHPECAFPLTRAEAIDIVNAIYDELPDDAEGKILAAQTRSLAILQASADEYRRAHKPAPVKPSKPPIGGWVYLVRSSSGLYKIGITTGDDCSERIKGIQHATGHDISLVVAAYARDCRGEEARLHAKFQEYRKHGEWFDFSESIAMVAASAVEAIK